jgi:hypothetical protein
MPVTKLSNIYLFWLCTIINNFTLPNIDTIFDQQMNFLVDRKFCQYIFCNTFIGIVAQYMCVCVCVFDELSFIVFVNKHIYIYIYIIYIFNLIWKCKIIDNST